jgi:hypothetical protein
MLPRFAGLPLACSNRPNTKRKHCAVRPDPRPFSLAPCSLGQGRCAPAPQVRRCRRLGDGILDCRCAVLCRPAGRDEGMLAFDRTKGCCF